MKSLRLTIVLLLFTLQLGAQSTWKYYSQDYWVQDIKTVDNLVFVGNPTGFHVIDIETKESKLNQSVNSALRGSFVWELLETDNKVWIALNEGGIAQYNITLDKLDGRFQQYYTPVEGDVDTIHRARNMIEDREGRLWFDSGWDSRGFLFSLQNGIVNDYNHLFAEQPRDFSCHGSERIYFRNNQSPLNYFELESSEIVSIDLPDNFTAVSSYTTLNDKLFAVFSDSLGQYIYVYDDSWRKISELDISLSLKQAVKGHNKIWVNDYQIDPGFISISEEGYQKYSLEDISGDQIIPGYRTEILHEERDGRIWLNTYKPDEIESYIYSINNVKIEQYEITQSSLKTSYLLRGYSDFDCQGNLIIPNLTTVQVFNPDTLIKFDILEDRGAGDLEMAAADPNSCMYFVARDGKSKDPSFIYVFEGSALIDTLELPNGWIGGLIVTTDGKLITSVSTYGIGFYDLATSQWNWYKDALWDPELNRYNGVFSIRENPTGAITFGTWNSLVVYDNGNWTTFDSSNSPLDRESIFTHLIDRKGNILVSYKGGIYKYNGTVWEYNSFYDPFQNGIASIMEDERGNYWLGTLGSGLLYWNGFTYEQYDIMNSAIPSNKIREILKHPINGDLWLIAERGLATFDRDAIYHKQGIFGKVYYDALQDADYDPGFDVGISDIHVDLEEEVVLSDINGNYGFYLENHDSIQVECLTPDDYGTTSPNTLSYYFEGEDILDANFGMWKEPGPAELDVDISVSPFLCASEVSVWLTLENSSWQTSEGTATLSLNPDIEILSTYPQADDITDGSITWSFEGISYLETRSLYAILQGPTVEDILMEHDSIEEVFIDLVATVNYNGIQTEEYETVQFLCAYDPNDKLSSSTGLSQEEFYLLKDDIEYTIRFQNEGNYKATNVIITDTLSRHLDYSTIEIIASSHPVQTHLKKNENTLVFRFIDINLPPKSENEAGSQGFVKFRISPKEGVEDYTPVANTAQIYFDNNAPIITNTTENILVEEFPTVSTEHISVDGIEVKAYPNPSDGRFEIQSNIYNYSYSIYTITGEKIMEGQTSNGYTSFEVDLPGLYIVTIQSPQGTKSLKLIRM